MTAVNLKQILIKNFRSLRGTVAVPLDASVVLLHGSNGMGKTSVLSAIELALSGQIAHLQRIDKEYAKQLLNREAEQGSISLFTRSDDLWTGKPEITINLTREGPTYSPLLYQEDAKFFSERCYLPQATLGRLLELYQDASTESTSQLTRFVKDLLGLDQLDALVDGLHPAFNVARVRNLVPEYRRFEGLVDSVNEEIGASSLNLQTAKTSVESDRREIADMLNAIYDKDVQAHSMLGDPQRLIAYVENDQADNAELLHLTSTRQEIQSLLKRWNDLPKDMGTEERDALEWEHGAARQRLEVWEKGDGQRLAAAINSLRDVFPDLPSSSASNPLDACNIAKVRAVEEKARCDRVANTSAAAAERVKALESELGKLRRRIAGRTTELSTLASDSSSLAQALAGIVPHLHDENCPVCGRNFEEVDEGPLSAHVSAMIASLTSQAGRLTAINSAQADDLNRRSVLERELLATQSGVLPPQDASNLSLRIAALAEGVAKLEALSATARIGSELMRAQNLAAERLSRANSRNEIAGQVASEASKFQQEWLQYLSAQPFATGDLLTELVSATTTRVTALRDREEKRRQIVRRLATYLDRLQQVARFEDELAKSRARLAELNVTSSHVLRIREEAKALSNAARHARTSIVGRVFNTALNKMWRDLFVRLAPQEQFVPAFKLESADGEPVEAGLETVHRSGERGGPPGTMLSAGNLNTAALTLFLALHLSVKNRLPWIILDDPVQSMDDVHIAQFAALLRTLSKNLRRQVIIAVHDRALFDYLALELSPAFPDDRLITVELSRNLAGDSLGTPTVTTFTADDSIAA
jgi:DNA repair protein SbcC/Rad50